MAAEVILETKKKGRKVVGYQMEIIDNRQLGTAQIVKQAEEASYQTDIYDYLGHDES